MVDKLLQHSTELQEIDMNSSQLGSGNAMDKWMGFKTPTLNAFSFTCEKRRSHTGKRIEDRKRTEVFTAFMDQPSDPIGGETRRVSVPAMDGEGHIVPERPRTPIETSVRQRGGNILDKQFLLVCQRYPHLRMVSQFESLRKNDLAMQRSVIVPAIASSAGKSPSSARIFV